MLIEHSLVVLNQEMVDHGLHCGDVGTVVGIYGNGKAYEVEFVDGDGSTIALLTLEPTAIRPIRAGELLHTRHRD